MGSHEENPLGAEKENKAIHGILVRILAKWRTAPQEETEEAFKETLIISPEALKKGESPLIRDQETEEILQKTVIFSPQGTARRDELPPAYEPEELSKTVILSPKGMGRETQAPVAEPGPTSGKRIQPAHEPEELSETVILSPKGMGRETQAPVAEPGPTSGKRIQPAHEPDELSDKDQFFEETVVLKPGKARDKANR
jgi:hypothetical protein